MNETLPEQQLEVMHQQQILRKQPEEVDKHSSPQWWIDVGYAKVKAKCKAWGLL